MDIISYILSRAYVKKTVIGLGYLKGSPCTVESVVKQDGQNIITLKWTATDGTIQRQKVYVDDGTPIYVWVSGYHYNYGDLVIYSSQFYRCIQENADVVFDETKWNGIGAADSSYGIVQRKALLPARFTSADRKMYYAIEDECFFLWDGNEWVAQDKYVAGDGITIQRDSTNKDNKIISVNSITQQELEDMWNN